MANWDFSFIEKTWIGLVVGIQFALLLIAVIGTVFFLIGRGLWNRHKLLKENQYNDKLVELLFSLSSEKQTVKQMPNIWFWQENIYRDVILGQIHAISGVERERLIEHYIRAGFFEKIERFFARASGGKD